MGATLKHALVLCAAALMGPLVNVTDASAQADAISCQRNAPYDYMSLPASVRAAVEQARGAQARAQAAAARARAGNGGIVYDYRPDGPEYVGYWYEGEWSGGTRNGYGSFRASEPSPTAGYTYDGQWQAGTYNGYGVETYQQGIRYEGTYANGAPSGYGVVWDPQGNTLYAGLFRQDSDLGQLWQACEGRL